MRNPESWRCDGDRNCWTQIYRIESRYMMQLYWSTAETAWLVSYLRHDRDDGVDYFISIKAEALKAEIFQWEDAVERVRELERLKD